jgi:hypothetical protein
MSRFRGPNRVSRLLAERPSAPFARLSVVRSLPAGGRGDGLLLNVVGASGSDPSTLPDPTDPANLGRIGGRGLLLIRTFMDSVTHNQAGYEITLVSHAFGNIGDAGFGDRWQVCGTHGEQRPQSLCRWPPERGPRLRRRTPQRRPAAGSR